MVPSGLMISEARFGVSPDGYGHTSMRSVLAGLAQSPLPGLLASEFWKNLSDWASRSCYSPSRCSLYYLSVGLSRFNMVRPYWAELTMLYTTTEDVSS